ncbi:unnamed protein product [Prorocentrum cordatum]|uniref:Peptidase S59 domain-containing protein n=1 Tax=Prorocentrum cordatum TaxID=2364126 RepID=A0ABN9VKD1_9DINO|nr:unnamed protein product [Polarella glacialis]
MFISRGQSRRSKGRVHVRSWAQTSFVRSLKYRRLRSPSPSAAGEAGPGCPRAGGRFRRRFWRRRRQCAPPPHVASRSSAYGFPAEVVVYPNQKLKPPVGEGLNRPASIVLYGCVAKTHGFKDEKSRERYKRRVRQMTEDKGAEFVSYDCDRGVWEFRVAHF